MFDAPGPRFRRRVFWVSVVSALVLAGLVALGLRQFASGGQLDPVRWRPYLTWPVWRYLLGGLWSTVVAACATGVLAMVGGLLLALRPNRFTRAYAEVMRTVPVLLLVYVMLFVLPSFGVNLPLFWKLVVPLALSHAASYAVIFRAGVDSVDPGQREAGLSLGMPDGAVTRFVVLPQAVRHMTPLLVTQAVSLLKDTSLGYVVSYTELLFNGRVLANYNGLLIQTFIVVAFIYLVVNLALSRLAHRLEAGRARTAR
ncbi:amino acid ABC transporter membrane protein 2 (PAAT family) [Lentzea atacamensis]|uniref:Amino acid ABC transporter membrane protein 2 (PAAT family) n=2 Tax=Lentzea TaxID=165301 RepID=A0A316HR19_9PSEU|nr:amino acid ABC transporter permease [Lentzea atacamensis]PWK80735.1 amino acid ABC transporter membrane protein 2 (PAAT family) [Lentzea atacamensis]